MMYSGDEDYGDDVTSGGGDHEPDATPELKELVKKAIETAEQEAQHG